MHSHTSTHSIYIKIQKGYWKRTWNHMYELSIQWTRHTGLNSSCIQPRSVKSGASLLSKVELCFLCSSGCLPLFVSGGSFSLDLTSLCWGLIFSAALLLLPILNLFVIPEWLNNTKRNPFPLCPSKRSMKRSLWTRSKVTENQITTVPGTMCSRHLAHT